MKLIRRSELFLSLKRYSESCIMSEEAGPSGTQRPPALSAKAAAAQARHEAETPEQRQARLQSQRERNAVKRAAEIPQQHQNRLQDRRRKDATRRAAETNEQRIERQQAAQERDKNRRRNAAAAGGPLYRAAVAGAYASRPTAHNLGPMTTECQYNYCRALHFALEKGNLLHNCCHDCKIATPPLSVYPDPLRHLLAGNTEESQKFRDHIRQYNHANAFASFGAKVEKVPGKGPPCYKISGEVYHWATATLVPNPRKPNEAPQPQFGQVFVYDPDAAVNYRLQAEENSKCDRQILATIDQVLRQVNPYVAQYRRLSEVAKEEDKAQQQGRPLKQYELRLMSKESDDQRRYNQPITNKDCMYLIESTDGEVQGSYKVSSPV